MLTYIVAALIGTATIQTTVQSHSCQVMHDQIISEYQESPYEMDISEVCGVDPARCTSYIDQCGGVE